MTSQYGLFWMLLWGALAAWWAVYLQSFLKAVFRFPTEFRLGKFWARVQYGWRTMTRVAICCRSEVVALQKMQYKIGVAYETPTLVAIVLSQEGYDALWTFRSCVKDYGMRFLDEVTDADAMAMINMEMGPNYVYAGMSEERSAARVQDSALWRELEEMS